MFATIVTQLRSKLAQDLYPHTPIEIEAAEDRIHFIVEGKWDSYEISAAGARKRVKEILQVNASFWMGEYP